MARGYATAPIRYVGAFARTVAFLKGLGIAVYHDPVADGFLDEVEIRMGALYVAREADDLAGELLHEAGHLAIIPDLFRGRADGDLGAIAAVMSQWVDEQWSLIGPDAPMIRTIVQCGECEAIAWRYAAALAIGIDSRLPFVRGFDGDGRALHDQVASGHYFGVHGLAAGGMTELPRMHAATPFPRMKRWLQI